jgi:hypothetical protein
MMAEIEGASAISGGLMIILETAEGQVNCMGVPGDCLMLVYDKSKIQNILCLLLKPTGGLI